MSDKGMNIQFDMPKNQSNVIKVIGVGGGGSNAINYMFEQGINGVDFVVCNTDGQALENSPVPIKVQLGVNLTEGLGAGANPEVGEKAALESFEEIKQLLDTNTKMLFITAGMGGGTGTGAAPIIAKQARDMDILTVGIVTIPFKFEGKVRMDQAQKGLEKLRQSVDSLIVIDNNKLREVYGNLGFRSGFSKADEVLATASKGIAEVITNHYMTNIDLRDAKTVLSHSGTAIMGSASASGDNRAQEAIIKALDSPLLNDNKITGAKNVLLLIVSGSEEITLDEIGEINDHIQLEAGHGANIIMGVGEDENLGEAISVTIIATGFSAEQQNHIANTEAKKIIHTLEDEQKSVHNLNPESSALPKLRNNPQPVVQPQKTENKIVHTLDEMPEVKVETKPEPKSTPAKPNMKLVPTSDLIKDMEIDYQEVIFDEDDFIFIDSSETSKKVEVLDEEEEPLFRFDFPIQPESDSKEEMNPEEDVDNIDVEDPITLFGSADEEQVTRYSLEDYLEKENELTNAKPEDPAEPRLMEDKPNQPIMQKSQIHETEVAEEEEAIDPLTTPISKQLMARAAERRARMKKFNYKFRKNSNVDEFERQPAYKRAGLDLNNNAAQNQDQISRSSLSEDDGDLHIRKNNSFLHDNVD